MFTLSYLHYKLHQRSLIPVCPGLAILPSRSAIGPESSLIEPKGALPMLPDLTHHGRLKPGSSSLPRKESQNGRHHARHPATPVIIYHDPTVYHPHGSPKATVAGITSGGRGTVASHRLSEWGEHQEMQGKGMRVPSNPTRGRQVPPARSATPRAGLVRFAATLAAPARPGEVRMARFGPRSIGVPR